MVNFWKMTVDDLKDKVKKLKQENKALRLQADTYFDEWQNTKKRIEGLEKELP